MALALGHEPIWNVFSRFGLGQPPGTGFPGESGGRLPSRPKWHAIEKVTLQRISTIGDGQVIDTADL